MQDRSDGHQDVRTPSEDAKAARMRTGGIGKKEGAGGAKIVLSPKKRKERVTFVAFRRRGAYKYVVLHKKRRFGNWNVGFAQCCKPLGFSLVLCRYWLPALTWGTCVSCVSCVSCFLAQVPDARPLLIGRLAALVPVLAVLAVLERKTVLWAHRCMRLRKSIKSFPSSLFSLFSLAQQIRRTSTSYNTTGSCELGRRERGRRSRLTRPFFRLLLFVLSFSILPPELRRT